MTVTEILQVWTGLDWTGLDWTGLDWTGLDWISLLSLLEEATVLHRRDCVPPCQEAGLVCGAPQLPLGQLAAAGGGQAVRCWTDLWPCPPCPPRPAGMARRPAGLRVLGPVRMEVTTY